MARLSLLLVLVTVALVLLTLTEVEGRGRRWRGGRGRGHWKHRSLQRVEGHHNKDKERVETLRRRAIRHMSFLDSLLNSTFGGSGLEFFNFLSMDPKNKIGPWWEGPNVCENESEKMVNYTTSVPEIMRHLSSAVRTCDQSDTDFKCTQIHHSTEGRREVTKIYECCHGYTRKKLDFGCPEKVNMMSFIEKARELGLTDFVKAVKTLKLTRELEGGYFTVFIPENRAFGLDSDLLDSGNGIILKDAPSVIAVSEPAVDDALKSLKNAILSHIIQGAIKSSRMGDEEIFETGSVEDSTIRINYFFKPEMIMTANCVPVVSRDHVVTNGIIHSVKKALRPVTESLLDIVKSRPELSTLKTVLASANYVSNLDEEGKLTLFAPTNDAFDRMNARLRQRLLNGDRKCLENVLKYHLLPNVICSTAIRGKARTPNLLKTYLNVTRTEDDKVFVNDAQVIQSDVMGTNGVMHVIDDVLIPEEALDFMDILEQKGFSELLNLVERAGLTKTLEMASNVTIFAPTNEAIKSLPIAVKTKLTNDADLLKDVLTYHVSPGVSARQGCHHFRDNGLIPTLQGKEIRTNLYSRFSYHTLRTAQCVPVTDNTIDACNGRINIIEKVMMPPNGNVIDVLGGDKKFSTLVSLVKRAGLADTLQGKGPFTVFAPNNEAFEKLSRETMAKLENDPRELEMVLKKHVFTETICCAGIRGHLHMHEWNLAGDLVNLFRDRNNTIRIRSARVVKCDLTATNGNVHEIDEVVMREPTRLRWSHWFWEP